VDEVLTLFAKAKEVLGGDFYRYSEGRYVRQKLGSKRGCRGYRLKEVKPGRKVLLCLTERGKTRAVSLLRDKGVDLRTVKDKRARRVIKRVREEDA